MEGGTIHEFGVAVGLHAPEFPSALRTAGFNVIPVQLTALVQSRRDGDHTCWLFHRARCDQLAQQGIGQVKVRQVIDLKALLERVIRLAVLGRPGAGVVDQNVQVIELHIEEFHKLLNRGQRRQIALKESELFRMGTCKE